MLKIKDNVDLKELEKFGFKFIEVKRYDEFEYFYEAEQDDETLTVDLKDKSIYTTCHSQFGYTETIFDVLFDLIQAGLVEKVEE
jgi:hypothetical protein